MWQSNPPTRDWNTSTNWNPATVPNASTDTATFAASATTFVLPSANIEVSGITFSAGGNTNYTITPGAANIRLTLSGTGITNNSGLIQRFVNPTNESGNLASILFSNSASAGSQTTFTNNAAQLKGAFGGTTFFFDSSSAGSGAFTNNGGLVSGGNGGFTKFNAVSTAGSGIFTNNGGFVSGALGGSTQFFNTATAGSGAFTNNGSTVGGADAGRTIFNDSSAAGSATISNNGPGGATSNGIGGWTFFNNSSTAGTATITNSGGTTDTIGDVPAEILMGGTHFSNTSSAATATINNTSTGYLVFYDSSTAANATVTNNALSLVIFKNNSTAANAVLTNIVLAAVIAFDDNSTASHATINNTNIPTTVDFSGNSTADHALLNNFNTSGFSGGSLNFYDQSTAANATIPNNGAIEFGGNATAANAQITNEKFGSVIFSDHSNGGSAFIENKSGALVHFRWAATGDGLTIVNESGAQVDLSDFLSATTPSVGVGSLSGAGNVFLGNRNLTLGALNRDETISGVIADGGQYGGTAGSLTKLGTGRLSLTNANTYSGGTLVNSGTLIAAHDGALGSGNVSVSGSGVLTLQNGATNDYIANAATLSIASSSTVNLIFTGAPDTIASFVVDGVAQAPGLYGSAASGAPNQLPELTGTGELLVAPVSQLLNISTRMRVLTGEQVLIAGFIITGSEQKKVIIRGIGPSLNGVGVTLSDPTLELHQGSITLATNDNWKINDQTGQSQEADIRATTIPPTNELESAIVMTLSPGAYTAILAGKNGGTGVGLVEVYDLAQGANSKLANISTRGFVDTDNNVMIGGLIVGNGAGVGVAKVIVRALGPSVPLAGVLADPTLELHDGSGTTLATNDNWKINDQTGQSQEADIRATTVPPTNDLESALIATLSPGNYTAIVRGKNNTIGVGLVEVYNLQ